MFVDEADDVDLDLDQGDECEAPALLVAAVAPRCNGRDGQAHVPVARLRMGMGMIRKQKERLRLQQQKVHNILRPVFATHVAMVAFGTQTAETSKVVSFGESAAMIPMTKRRNRSGDYLKCLSYGLCGAVNAQATGIARFINDIENSTVLNTVSSVTFDDASMWVKDLVSKADRENGSRIEGLRYNNKLWKRGKTIHLPVCNTTEFLLGRRT